MTDSVFNPVLLEPAGSAGEDLEYVAAFSEFMALSVPREERQVGEHLIPAQPPNWSEVFKMGCALLEKSRDLRILTKVCQAALHRYGLPGLAQGLTLMARWVENDWDHLYPQIEADGAYDPLLRSNVISELSSREGFVHSLRQAVFLETPIGAVTISAVEQVLEGKQEGSLISSPEQLGRMLVEERDKNQGRLNAVSSISSSLASINSAIKTRLESEYWPNIDLLAKTVSRIERFINEQLHEEEQEQASHDPSPGDAGETAAPRSSGPLPSKLSTRADACKALAMAREYFERHEPSHPAPMLIRRVERITSSNFLAIIEELMPEAAETVRQLAGERFSG